MNSKMRISKNKKSNTRLAIVVFSLLAIVGILTTGFMLNNPFKKEKFGEDRGVLGERVVVTSITPTSTIDVNHLVQETLETTKETVSSKVIEIKEKTIKEIERQVAKLSQSQIDALKLQLCTEWGMITAATGEDN